MSGSEPPRTPPISPGFPKTQPSPASTSTSLLVGLNPRARAHSQGSSIPQPRRRPRRGRLPAAAWACREPPPACPPVLIGTPQGVGQNKPDEFANRQNQSLASAIPNAPVLTGLSREQACRKLLADFSGWPLSMRQPQEQQRQRPHGEVWGKGKAPTFSF